MVQPIIVVDPFFDSSPNQRTMQRYGSRTADHETFATHDAKGMPIQGMLAGRPLSAVLPTAAIAGKGRVSNMIVSPATEGGVPMGFNPNVISDIVIEIDPQIHGANTVRVPFSQLREGMVQESFDAATAALPPDGSVERQRLRGAATYHSLAGITSGQTAPVTPDAQDASKTAMVREAPAPQAGVQFGTAKRIPIPGQQVVQPAPQPQPQPQPQVQMNQPMQVASWGTASPMAALRAPVPAPQAQQAQMPQAMQAMQLAPNVAAPSRRVRYEFELQSAKGAFAFNQDASYHDVLHIPGFIVLVWDNRYTAAPQYEPPTGEQAPPTAIMLEGDPHAYLVSTTPIRYVHRDFMYSVLMIEKAVPLPQQ